MPHFIQALRNIFSVHPKLRRRKSKNDRAEQLETRELLAATVIDTNFNSGTSEVSLTGTAFSRSSNTDVVLTQQGIQNQQGSLIVNSTGTARWSFSAQIRAYVGGDATGADGYSFGYGSIPSATSFGEGGLSSGVWISVDTYNGSSSNGAIRSYYNGSLLREDLFTGTSRSHLAPDGRRYLNFAVTESGLLTYSHDNLSQRSIQLSGWNPQSNWRYGVGARTGGETDVHVVDELHIFDNTETPTNLSLSASTVNENDSGATVGTLSTTDAGGSTSFTYSLVSGTGSTDNSSFQIVGNQLRTATGLNFEAGGSRSVRIRTTDQAGLSFERAFSISVTNLNEAPTDISLSGTTVSENQPAGIAVGSFSSSDPDSGNTFTYSLVSGTGSTDNASFQIVGNSLRTSTSLNFEAGSTRSVRVRTSDQNGLTYDEAFTITVLNVNEAPSDITLSNSSVAENQPIGTAVGTLSTVDPDAGGSFSYQLMSGTGDTDNAQFEILNGELKTKAVFDFEVKPSYSVRLRTTDSGGLSFEKAITINVFDMDEIPPKVTNSGFLASGTLPANATSLTVTFSESTIGATTASNYELRRAGADGLLGNSDDPIVNISLVTMVTGTARLNFAALTDDVYRLTVKDTITDSVGNALDGDNSGISGANWWRDFVVGPLNTSLTSANGLIFNPEFGGGGAGQLVHGPGFAFDGHGRLTIGSAGVVGGTSPILLRTAMASNSSSTLTGVATVPFNVLVSTATGAPTPNTTTNDQSIDADGEYLIAARVALQNVSTNRAVVLSISKNGAVISSKIHQLQANMTFAYETVDVSDRLNLLAGDKVSIKLETIGGSSTLYTGNPHGSFFHVSRISQVIDSVSAIPATVMSSNSTSTLPGLATVPFNLLVSTAPGAPAASTTASEQTVSSDGEYEVSARLTLQSVNTNRPVVLSILRDGALVSSKRYQLVANSNFAYETIDISDRLVLVAGNKISIRLETLSGSSTLYNQGAHAAFFQLSKVANGLEAISSIRTTVMQSDNTSTLSGVATVPFNLLVSTGNGSPSANTATSEQTVPTNGDYTVSARVTLQDVFTNRTVILSIAKNGSVISSKIHQLLANLSSPYETVDITDRLNLVAGDKISIKLETLGANSKLWGVAHATSFQVSKNVDIPTATLADSGASFRTNPEFVSSLSVSRKLTVPSAGSQDFARTIDSFSNSTGAAITAPIRIVGNLGSDATTSVFATSDGDLLVEPTDLWFGTDDADGTGTPPIIHLLHGPFGLQPTSVNVIQDNVEWTYNLTVPAGATTRLAHFTVLGTTRAQAIAAANALVTTNGFGGEAAAFLTNDELSSLVNFQFNTAPTDLTLSSNTVAENSPADSSVGNFSSVDANSGDVFAYSLVTGTGDTDSAQFTIIGNTLKTVAPFDFETKPSYSIRVRTTDQGGLSFEKIFTISVTDVQEDVTAPQSLIAALPAASGTLTFPVTASAVDPGGVAASGVFEIDFYYSTGGSFVKFATSPASNPTANFTGAPNTTYWFRSIARDNAGNVEAKTSADTYTRIGDVLPPTTQVMSATHNSGGLFTIHMTGSKIGGAPMTAFDVYVVIDSNAPVLIGTAGAGAATAGVYSASLLYQGLTDGNSHSYRFYSVGKDSAGNLEAAPVSGDVTVTVSFSSGSLTLGAIDVQNGTGQRSYVRHLDLLFSSSTGLSSLANTGRVRVERFGADAASVNPGTGTLISGFTVNQSGNRLKLDFGATGLGGLRQAGNGFYRVLVDIDGNGNFTDAGDGAMEFHRLFGDADGNGIVDIADTNLVTSQIGRTGTNLDGDLDGNGSVNSTDRLFTVQQRGRKLLDPLLGWLDD